MGRFRDGKNVRLKGKQGKICDKEETEDGRDGRRNPGGIKRRQ